MLLGIVKALDVIERVGFRQVSGSGGFERKVISLFKRRTQLVGRRPTELDLSGLSTGDFDLEPRSPLDQLALNFRSWPMAVLDPNRSICELKSSHWHNRRLWDIVRDH